MPTSSYAVNHQSDAPTISRRGGPKRLVVAEDDPDLREVLALAMRGDGYEVIELEDGSQLLDFLALHILDESECSAVDLVISDVRMPGKSGFDVLAGVRWSLHPPPFILVTAFATPQARAEATRLGAVALVAKPLNLDEIRSLVRGIAPKSLV